MPKVNSCLIASLIYEMPNAASTRTTTSATTSSVRVNPCLVELVFMVSRQRFLQIDARNQGPSPSNSSICFTCCISLPSVRHFGQIKRRASAPAVVGAPHMAQLMVFLLERSMMQSPHRQLTTSPESGSSSFQILNPDQTGGQSLLQSLIYRGLLNKHRVYR